MFLIRNFSGFTELGLTPQQVGGSPQQIWAFSPELYRYISHLHVAISGYMLGIGILSIALAWYGIRRGERWALWTILLGTAITAAVAVPLRYPYGLATVGHLGALYLELLLLVVGIAIAYSGLGKEERSRSV